MNRVQQRSQRTSPNPSEALDFLAGHRMFGVLPRSDLAELAAAVAQRRFPKAHNLAYSGDSASHVFVVRSGLIALTDIDSCGNRHVLVTFSPGDVFGGTAAVLGLPHTGTATAVVDTEVIAVPRDTFDRLCRRRPELIREILRELYETVCRAEQTILALTMKQTGPRIAAFLLKSAREAAGPGGAPFTFELTLSHHDLALLLGTTRETISRVLARLSRAKVITINGRRVFILRPDALQELTRS